MLKGKDRIKVVKEKTSWNGKRVMAKIGQEGVVLVDQLYEKDKVYAQLDNHKKAIWLQYWNVEKIN